MRSFIYVYGVEFNFIMPIKHIWSRIGHLLLTTFSPNRDPLHVGNYYIIYALRDHDLTSCKY